MVFFIIKLSYLQGSQKTTSRLYLFIGLTRQLLKNAKENRGGYGGRAARSPRRAHTPTSVEVDAAAVRDVAHSAGAVGGLVPDTRARLS